MPIRMQMLVRNVFVSSTGALQHSGNSSTPAIRSPGCQKTCECRCFKRDYVAENDERHVYQYQRDKRKGACYHYITELLRRPSASSGAVGHAPQEKRRRDTQYLHYNVELRSLTSFNMKPVSCRRSICDTDHSNYEQGCLEVTLLLVFRSKPSK